MEFLIETDPPVTTEDFFALLPMPRHIERATKNCELTELERLFYQLIAITDSDVSSTTYWIPPTFKTDDTYLTLEGYKLGSVVWYMRCAVEGLPVNVFGKTQEMALTNAIQFFVGFSKFCKNTPDRSIWYRFFNSFEQQQRLKSAEWGRYINRPQESAP